MSDPNVLTPSDVRCFTRSAGSDMIGYSSMRKLNRKGQGKGKYTCLHSVSSFSFRAVWNFVKLGSYFWWVCSLGESKASVQVQWQALPCKRGHHKIHQQPILRVFHIALKKCIKEKLLHRLNSLKCCSTKGELSPETLDRLLTTVFQFTLGKPA